MYIELVGLPGAGKTSLYRQLAKLSDFATMKDVRLQREFGDRTVIPLRKFAWRHIHNYAGWPRMRDLADFAIENQDFLCNLIGLTSNLNRDSTLIAERTFATLADYLRANSPTHIDDFVVVDEGINQRMYSYFLRGVDPTSLDWPPVDLLVHVDVSLDCAQHRRRLRGDMRTDVDARSASYISRIVSTSQGDVLTLDGEATIRQMVDKVRSHLIDGADSR